MESITEQDIRDCLSGSSVDLQCSQKNICLPIVERIYRKMKANVKFKPIKVCGDIICDGHHRYVASVLAQVQLERDKYITTSATNTIDWKSIGFVMDDWDTDAKIQVIDKEDADFNSMTVEELIKLYK